MLQNHCDDGHSNWTCEDKKLLYHYGLVVAWENQDSLENDVFLIREFKMRVFDCDK